MCRDQRTSGARGFPPSSHSSESYVVKKSASDLHCARRRMSNCRLWGAVLMLCHCLHPYAGALNTDCFVDRAGKLTCLCFGADRGDGEVPLDLSEVAASYVNFASVPIRHLEVKNCNDLNLFLNLRALVVDGVAQNLTMVSFGNVNKLMLDIREIDHGDKQFVFRGVKQLILTGNLDNPFTRVSFFSLGDRFDKGEVTFKDFFSRSSVQLINIQDAKRLKVVNAGFEDVVEIDIVRTDFCYADAEVIDCSETEELFDSSPVLTQALRNAILISVVAVFVVAIVVTVIYVKHWKKKKELELLGYPASTLSRNTPVPSSTGGKTETKR